MEKQNTVIEMKHIVKEIKRFKKNNNIKQKIHKGKKLEILGENPKSISPTID